MFNKLCLICNKEFETLPVGNMLVPISKGHEECAKLLDAQDKRIKELREKKAKADQQEIDLQNAFDDAGLDWTRRGWDQWVENDENKVVTGFLRAWRYDDKGVVLSGSPGIGKTHLLAATALHLYFTSFQRFRFIKFARWCDRIRSSPFEQARESVCQLEDANILFIDDLGANSITDHIEDKLCQILDYRLEFKLPTFISTNMNLNNAEKILSARMMSRLLGLCEWIEISTISKDWRQK